MRVFLSAVMAVGFFVCALGAAEAAGNAAAGKLKVANCEGCHGQASRHPTAPKLAGQPQAYTEQQLIAFRDGTRNDPVMKGMVAVLSTEQDVKDVAAYYASLSYPLDGAVKVSAKARMAEGLYMNKCAMCHGARGAGVAAGGGKADAMGGMFGGGMMASGKDVPLIGGQPEAYLAKALQDYRSGARKSTNSFVMDIVARDMTDSQIAVMAKYLSSLAGNMPQGESLAQSD